MNVGLKKSTDVTKMNIRMLQHLFMSINYPYIRSYVLNATYVTFTVP